MNKRTLTIVAIILILITSGMIYLLASKGTDPSIASTAENRSASNQSDAPLSAAEPLKPSGKYIEYKEGIIAETSDTKLLFFHAPWCPQCVALEKDIQTKGVPEGTAIIKVDYDNSRDLRSKYGVTIQTTIVRVDDSGNLVEKFVAYDDPTVSAVTKELL